MHGLLTLFASLLRAPRIRAEAIAAIWELFSALLFVSAVVPAIFSTPWPAVILLASMVLSASLTGVLMRRGDRGFVIAGGLRTLSWMLAISPVAASASDSPSWIELLVTALAFGLMAGGIRRTLYRRVLEVNLSSRTQKDLAAGLRPRLAEAAMAAGIVGGHVMLLFSVAFLRTQSQVIFQAWVELVPVLALLGTVGFTLAVRPATHAIVRALVAGPDADQSLLRKGLAQAESVPDLLAYLNFALWFAFTAIGVIYVRPGSSSKMASALPLGNVGDVLLQLGFGLLFASGVSFYQRVWHRDNVSESIATLRSWTGRLGHDDEHHITLGRRMLRDFGLPLLFTGMLSLFSSIALYRTLASHLSWQEDFNAITALFASFLLLMIAAFGVVMRAARELSRPMTKLAQAADEVAHGNLEAAVPALRGPTEVVGLGESVERMRQALAHTIAELEEERSGLEQNVALRTAELRHALEELKRTQAALVQGERLASIGELVSGVAHEIYNPLNAIAGAAQPLERLANELRTMIDAYQQAEAELSPQRCKAITELRDELDIQASLDDLRGISTVIKRAVERSVRIVANLKNFSRVPGEALPVDLHTGLEETLLLLGPRLRQSSIHIVKNYGDLPPVICRGGEINQVFMNLLVNAIQALESCLNAEDSTAPDPLEIKIGTWLEGNLAVVAISDNGPGIAPELVNKIFDPFFTTKPRGHGTGLGLSISTDILRRHGGTLSLESDGAVKPMCSSTEADCGSTPSARGACFVCRLPIRPDSSTQQKAPV